MNTLFTCTQNTIHKCCFIMETIRNNTGSF